MDCQYVSPSAFAASYCPAGTAAGLQEQQQCFETKERELKQESDAKMQLELQLKEQQVGRLVREVPARGRYHSFLREGPLGHEFRSFMLRSLGVLVFGSEGPGVWRAFAFRCLLARKTLARGTCLG